jgi:cytochrome c peroxidase
MLPAPRIVVAVAVAVVFVAACVAVGGCVDGPGVDVDADPFPLALPAGFPLPVVPEDNPITEAKIALGRRLFFDTRLSANETQSCGTCHEPARAFTDAKALPTGSTGDVVPRNSMMLANVAWWSTYTWANPSLTTLEDQALVPLLAEHPVELGITNVVPDVLARFAADADVARAFDAAFVDDEDPITLVNIAKAIATYERSLISGNSRYDRYVNGDGDLSDDEKRGLILFNSETTECYHCHGGPFFSTAFVSTSSPFAEPSFHNTGLYNLDDAGAYPADNPGLFAFTGNADDMGKFRVPTLRNLSLSAPYFHDGSAATLEDVLAHYMAGGRTIAAGDRQGNGSENPHKNPLVRPFVLTADEQRSLIAFLRALDDDSFVDAHRGDAEFVDAP